MIGIQCSGRNGALVGAVQVTEAHELMLISDQGTLVRIGVPEVSQLGRNALIRVPADETLVSVMRLDAEEHNGEDAGVVDANAPAGDDGSRDVEPVGTDQ